MRVFDYPCDLFVTLATFLQMTEGSKTVKGGARMSSVEAAEASSSKDESNGPEIVELPIDPERTYRIYADGVFDLFHFGHAKMLEQCKKLVPKCFLIVGVTSDAMTHGNKGITVMDEKERAESLRHCRWVDEVVENAPWIITEEFVNEHNIDFVAHDPAPYPSPDGSCPDIYGWLKEQGKFKATRRTDGISTTDLVIRIVRNYDDYILRNLSRGVSREDMNVSFFQEKSAQFSKKYTELKSKSEDVKKTAKTIIEVGKRAIREEMDGVVSMIDFRTLKKHLLPEFMKLFGPRSHQITHYASDDSAEYEQDKSPQSSRSSLELPNEAKRRRTQQDSE